MTERVRLEKATLIMTVLNESTNIREFLDSLLAQSVIPEEIIVVDGGSTDGTVEIIERWGEQSPARVKVIVIPGANISHGRNQAIGHATHENILVSDAGVSLYPGWVESLLASLNDGNDVAAGFYAPQRGERFFQDTLARIITPLLSEINPANFLPSSRSIAFTKNAWSVAGKYPEWLDYCEDLVFDMAMNEAGLRIAFTPEAIAAWDARSSVRAYIKQYYRYARGDGKADLFRKRQAARYLAYGGGALALIASRKRPVIAGVFPPLGALYLSKFTKRVWASREEVGLPRTVMRTALIPFVVATGDIAKMVGYPVGVVWRLQHPEIRDPKTS